MVDPSSRKAKWDARHREATGPGEPARVLADNAHLLPSAGEALDVACGLGANALLLARRGLQVRGWDYSEVAVARLREHAAEAGVVVHGEVRNVVEAPPAPASFDVIVVAHFLERELFPSLIGALRSGGLLFYQTFTREAVTDRGPPSDAFRLGENELLDLCAGLVVRVYREEGTIGATTEGVRDEAMFIGEKR